ESSVKNAKRLQRPVTERESRPEGLCSVVEQAPISTACLRLGRTREPLLLGALSMARKRIGELLLERKVITVPQLEEGLALHRQTRQRLGVALIQKGFVTEEQLVQVLSEALSIGTVDLKATTAEWSAIHMLRARFCESN